MLGSYTLPCHSQLVYYKVVLGSVYVFRAIECQPTRFRLRIYIRHFNIYNEATVTDKGIQHSKSLNRTELSLFLLYNMCCATNSIGCATDSMRFTTHLGRYNFHDFKDYLTLNVLGLRI